MFCSFLSKIYKGQAVLIWMLLLGQIQAPAQENYRLIKSDYFVENPLFQNYVTKNNWKQTVTREGNLIRTTTYDAKGAVFQDMYCSDFHGNVVKDEGLGTYGEDHFAAGYKAIHRGAGLWRFLRRLFGSRQLLYKRWVDFYRVYVARAQGIWKWVRSLHGRYPK